MEKGTIQEYRRSKTGNGVRIKTFGVTRKALAEKHQLSTGQSGMVGEENRERRNLQV